MERSIHSARACFIENLAPMMTKGEVSVLDSWYRFFAGEETQHVDVGVDLVIYLRVSHGFIYRLAGKYFNRNLM